jgi:hypothetical protein
MASKPSATASDAATTLQTKPPDSSATSAAAHTSAEAAPDGGSTWAHFSLKNQVPLCIFADYEQYERAPFLKDVKKTARTRPHVPVVFGVYGLGCASLRCVQAPTLQCWAEVEGQDIKVQTRYSGVHSVGTTCRTDCESVTAACDTPNLLPGRYTLHYGDKRVSLQIPGPHHPACLIP